MPDQNSPAQKLAVLDSMRGGASLYVLVYHALGILTSPPGPREGRQWWEWLQVLIWFIMRHGRGFVMLFFVLSGIVIHLGLARTHQNGQANFVLTRYAKRRIARLYPPLIAALLFTFLLDQLGHLFYPSFYAGNAPQSGMASMLSSADISWPTFLGNLFFLQEFVTPSWGTNAVLWSLAYEGFFYVLYPLIFVTLYLTKNRVWAFGVSWMFSILSAGVWMLTGISIFSIPVYFGMWLLGAAIAEISVSNHRNIWAGWAFILGAIILMVLLVMYGMLSTTLDDWGWGVAWALLLLGLVVGPEWKIIDWGQQSIRWLRYLAPQSYTLYLFHTPLLVFISAAYLKYWTALPTHFGLALSGIVLCLLISALCARWLERMARV